MTTRVLEKTGHHQFIFLKILCLCYDGKDRVGFSDAFKMSEMRLVPAFLNFMKKMEDSGFVRKSEGLGENDEASWQITEKGKKILKKYGELRKEIGIRKEHQL